MPDLAGRDDFEKRLARKLGRLLGALMGQLLEALGDPPDVNNLPAGFWTDAGMTLRQAIQPELEAIYLESAEAMLGATPIGVEWGVVNTSAVQWARQYTFDLVSGINRTSERLLQESISAFFDEGLTIGDLRARLAGAFGPIRADLIASTEVTRAAVEGERTIIDELIGQGVQFEQVWQTSEDEAVCPICRPLDGQRQSVGQSFVHPMTGAPYHGPPAHPRCRCWLNHEPVMEAAPA